MQLIIGNKNYSSWSMRSWALLRHFCIPFTERKLRFDLNPESAFYAELALITPAGKVPVLVEDDGFAVWDTLAIAEYIADIHPEYTIWPRDGRWRAQPVRRDACWLHAVAQPLPDEHRGAAAKLGP